MTERRIHSNLQKEAGALQFRFPSNSIRRRKHLKRGVFDGLSASAVKKCPTGKKGICAPVLCRFGYFFVFCESKCISREYSCIKSAERIKNTNPAKHARNIHRIAENGNKNTKPDGETYCKRRKRERRGGYHAKREGKRDK